MVSMFPEELNTSHKCRDCDCRTDERTFIIVSDLDMAEFPDLQACATSLDWKRVDSLGALAVRLGGATHWGSVAELVNFIRAVVGQDRLSSLRGTWVRRDQPIESQRSEIERALPLEHFAKVNRPELMELLISGRIETWYQPIVDARSLTIWGYECLMRGRTADGRVVPPGEMLEWARQERMEFMLDRVCRERHLRNAGNAGIRPDRFISINFLPTAIYQPQFCLKTSMEAAKASGLTPERIIFEVVETESLTDREHLSNILDYYRKSGFKVALDDVSAGYAGLAMLGDLDPDLIKLDRELIVRAQNSKIHLAICKSLAKLAREIEKPLLAEGIETIEQLQMLESIGIDLYQGYLFGKPNPKPLESVSIAQPAS